MSVVSHSGENEESKTAEVAVEGLDPLVGQTIDGRFRVVDVIGKGAMGKVYRAVQLPLNRAVALKVLDSRYGAGKDESFKQRFLVEAALTSKLNHPNTVRVVDYGSTKDGLFFLAMEYLDGETLEKLLSKGPLPWHRALSIAQQMARALREAHELGVVHRDLKPANVVMLHADDDTDFVKILEFGLVKSFIEGQELEGRAITKQGMLMGSPPYMAPEQGEKNRSDPRSDIYALGTMLFEMLTGQPPFTGGSALEVIMKHVREPVPPMVTPGKFEAVPESVAAIVQKCLAKSPMDRFQSMDELLLAMQDVAPPAREPQRELPRTEVHVPLALPPTEEHDALESPPRSPSVMLIAGFFVAAVAGVLGTWAVVKPATETKLVFHLESTPEGASVMVDGKSMGVTPIDLEQGLQNGRAGIELTLQKDGFATSVVKLNANGGRLEFAQTLTPLPVPVPVPEPTAAKVETPKVAPTPVVKKDPEPVPTKEPEPVPTKEPEPSLIDKAFAGPPPSTTPVVKKQPEPVAKKQPEPVAKKQTEPVVKKQPKAPVVATKAEPKKAATKIEPVGPRPASKLDEDEDTTAPKSELKRPNAQP